MAEIDLLGRYPMENRDIARRHAAQKRERAVAMRFGHKYFDGTREQGYGGYRYDGRWLPVAEDIVAHFGLKAGDRVLDIGCAKGFLVKDLMTACPGLEAFGLDISEYAIANAHPEIAVRLRQGDAAALPYGDGEFTVALSINTIHNLDRAGCIRALGEMQRVAPGGGYVQVDSYRNAAEKQAFEDWVLTAITHYDPAGWKALFAEAGYRGDYYWTIT